MQQLFKIFCSSHVLTRVAGASPAALGNKLPGFLLSNPKIFKHENKAQTFTRRFVARSKLVVSVFAFLILFNNARAQVVSGRVGVFRDSIYVNGKWYRSFSDSTVLPFNNVLLSSEGGNFVRSVGNISDTVFTYDPNRALVGVDSADGVRVNVYGFSRFIGDTSFSHSPVPFYWDNGSIQFLLTNSYILFTTSDQVPSQLAYISHSGQFFPTFGVDDSSFLAGIFRNDVGVNPIAIYKVGGNSNAAKIYFRSQIPDSPVTQQGGVFLFGNSYIYSGFNTSKNVLKVLPDSLTSFYVNGKSYFGAQYGNADSTLTVKGGVNISSGVNIGGNLSAVGNYTTSNGRIYVRTGSSILTNNNAAADINLQGAVAASTVALNTDSIVLRNSYTIPGAQSTPTVLYVYNNSGVNDSIYLPPVSYMYNLGQNVSAMLGTSYDVVIANFTPTSVLQQVIVFPNPADAGALINGASSLVIPALTVKRFRAWKVGSSKIWLAY